MDLVKASVLSLQNTPALRYVTMQLTRDGEQTPALKVARFLDRDMLTRVVFATTYASTQMFLASAIDAGWLVVAVDETPAARAGATFVQVDSDVTVALDLNDGSGGGGGGGGEPATLAASARVEKLPAQRDVVVVERAVDGVWRVAGSGVTDVAGAVQLDLRVTPSARVYAMATDDYGIPFQADLAVQVGRRIRPTQYSGWVYEITEAGQLPSTEPEWWAAVGDNPSQLIGTARAVARRYFQPIAHGPVPVEVT